MSTYTEDHLVEQPAIQLMQHELGWEVEGNVEHRTLNMKHRSEEKRKTWTKPAFQLLNPDLPVEELEILNFECWILNGRGRGQAVLRLNPELPVEANREIEQSGFPLAVGSLVFKQPL